MAMKPSSMLTCALALAINMPALADDAKTPTPPPTVACAEIRVIDAASGRGVF